MKSYLEQQCMNLAQQQPLGTIMLIVYKRSLQEKKIVCEEKWHAARIMSHDMVDRASYISKLPAAGHSSAIGVPALHCLRYKKLRKISIVALAPRCPPSDYSGLGGGPGGLIGGCQP